MAIHSQRRFGSHALSCLAVVLVCSTLASACDVGTKERASEPRAVLSDRQAAREFLAAVDHFRIRVDPLLTAGSAIASAQEQSCPTLLRPPAANRRLRIRIAVIDAGITQLIRSKAVAPAYRELVATVGRIPTENPVLQSLVQEANRMATEAAKLEAAEIDLCRLLEEWKETGWSKSFEIKLGNAPFVLFDIDEQRVSEAHRKAASSIDPLQQRLGLNLEKALAITTIASLPL